MIKEVLQLRIICQNHGLFDKNTMVN